ncbi:MAG TPA: radical SAM protein [Polyangia bacterium]|jgi:uncharacterized protein
MRLARATIVASVPGTAEALLVQPLTQQVVLVPAEQAEQLAGLAAGGPAPALSDEDARDLAAAGFLVASEDEERAQLAEAYADYLAETARTPTQLVVVPSFACNLRCTYCYQDAFTPAEHGLISPSTLAALFAYVDRYHGAEDPRPYLTLFGGEPLVDSPAHHDRLERVLAGAQARGLEVAVVTNGYDLGAFVGRLAQGPVKEVQVTVDGPAGVHDARRPHATGAGTFDRGVAGIDLLVGAGIPVNLRVVVDRENLEALPALASVAAAHGWLAQPEARFKTQVGRNYELYGCASRQRREDLFGRLELWARYAELSAAHPELRRFHRPRLHGMRHLAETGAFPVPNFDACPAAKKEWAFAPDGGVYGCTATVGHPEHRLGRYAPVIERDEAAIARLQQRSVLTMSGCDGCALGPVCGGGCAAVAHQQHGDVLASDCRPVRELLGLGAKYYGIA